MMTNSFYTLKTIPVSLIILFYAGLSLAGGYTLGSVYTIQILLLLHPLYYLGVFRPGAFPVWLAFLLGFFVDLQVGRLLGLNAFLLVVLSLLIHEQQRYLRSQPFATQWAGFLVMCFGVEGVRWAVMTVTHMTVFSPVSAGISALANAALYPLSAVCMGAVLKMLFGRHDVEKLGD